MLVYSFYTIYDVKNVRQKCMYKLIKCHFFPPINKIVLYLYKLWRSRRGASNRYNGWWQATRCKIKEYLYFSYYTKIITDKRAPKHHHHIMAPLRTRQNASPEEQHVEGHLSQDPLEERSAEPNGNHRQQVRDQRLLQCRLRFVAVGATRISVGGRRRVYAIVVHGADGARCSRRYGRHGSGRERRWLCLCGPVDCHGDRWRFGVLVTRSVARRHYGPDAARLAAVEHLFHVPFNVQPLVSVFQQVGQRF